MSPPATPLTYYTAFLRAQNSTISSSAPQPALNTPHPGRIESPVLRSTPHKLHPGSSALPVLGSTPHPTTRFGGTFSPGMPMPLMASSQTQFPLAKNGSSQALYWSWQTMWRSTWSKIPPSSLWRCGSLSLHNIFHAQARHNTCHGLHHPRPFQPPPPQHHSCQTVRSLDPT